MKSTELRTKFLEFFKSKNHSIIPSASLIPEGDSSTLFIGSGMQPLVPYLLGEKHPLGKRLCNAQKSFRVEDIEEVGDSRHNTFFEMLGNWSLGDYFKKEQLPWAYEFLIEVVGLDPQRLYATVFRGDDTIGVPRDTESVEILKTVFQKYHIEAVDIDFSEKEGMGKGKIFYYPAKKNWWSKSGTPDKMPLGEIGGPDSEIFYDLGVELKKHEQSPWATEPCHVNCDCGRFIEIGNNVFIQYKKTAQGFEPLEQQNVDFGGGFERLVMVSQGLDNVFLTDLFLDIITTLEKLSGKKYSDNKKPFEVIADHIKASTLIIGDDSLVSPSNTGQGYIVRRLIRRAIRFGKKLGIEKSGWIEEVAKVVVSIYKDTYSEIEENYQRVAKELILEEFRFENTIKNGLKTIKDLFKRENNLETFGLNDTILFDLYQTHGFPIELSLEEINNERIHRGLPIMDQVLKDGYLERFNKMLNKHQELSRTASAGMFKGGLADHDPKTIRLHTAHHLLLAVLQELFGKRVKQRGSNITQDRLRLDFSFDRKLTDDEKKDIEAKVNQYIHAGLEVEKKEMPKEEAEKIGAEMEFGVKYGNTVSVYFIQDAQGMVVSKEFCGGPHVENTKELGVFKIVKEEASSQGVRRIKAVLQ